MNIEELLIAIEKSVLRDYSLVVMKHAGIIPDDEFLDSYKNFFAGDTFDQSMNLLVDLREADSTPRSQEALQRSAHFINSTLSGFEGRMKVAVIAPNDLSFGLARMYEAYVNISSWDFVVFRSVDTALAWLGLPEDLLNS